MKICSVVPTIWTNKVQETVEFYREKLGFQCAASMEEWSCLEHDGIEFMVAAPTEHEPFTRPQFTGTFYFKVTGVDEMWMKVKDHTEVVYRIEDFDYGMREFCILDNNGYRLQFGEEIA